MNEEIYNDYLKLSGEITEKLDNTASYEIWLIIQEYIDILIKENQQLKEQYCERTDCSGRIGNSKKVEELQKENQQLKEIIDKARELLVKWGEEPDADMYMQIKEYKEHRELLEILDNKGE